MKRHAHVIPNIGCVDNNDRNTWYRVVHFDGRGQWNFVSEPMNKESAQRFVRAFNRKQSRLKAAKALVDTEGQTDE